MKLFIAVGISLFLWGCSSSQSKTPLRVGVDHSWYSWNFGLQTAVVNGFVDDFLMLMAEERGIHLEKIGANWDFLLEGMGKDQFDVVLSSLPAYSFNLALYDFSENFLDLGLVLVAPIDSLVDLDQIKGSFLGVLVGRSAESLLQKMPDLKLREYTSISHLLDAVVNQEIKGAFLDTILASNYVNDLYGNRLRVVSGPLTDSGLHFLAVKGKHTDLIRSLDRGVASLKEKEKLNDLMKKWGLYVRAR